MKLNCGAERHHYSTFDVQCSMLDVHLFICSMFIFYKGDLLIFRLQFLDWPCLLSLS